MHGEYKVPGGKLVVVDLEVRDGLISDFHLAGDFFLEPDTALEAIDAAVRGLPETADVTAIAAAVRAALPSVSGMGDDVRHSASGSGTSRRSSSDRSSRCAMRSTRRARRATDSMSSVESRAAGR